MGHYVNYTKHTHAKLRKEHYVLKRMAAAGSREAARRGLRKRAIHDFGE